VAGCGEGLWGSRLGMFVWSVLLVGMHVSGGVMVGWVRCDFFVLLGAGFSLGLTMGFFFWRDIVSGFLSIPYGDVSWAWAFTFVDVCFFVVDVLGPLLYDGCVVVAGAFC